MSNLFFINFDIVALFFIVGKKGNELGKEGDSGQ
jgi:hypothetical protein